MKFPGMKLYPQGLQFTAGHGVGVCGGCGTFVSARAGCGIDVAVVIGMDVGVGRVGTVVLITSAA